MKKYWLIIDSYVFVWTNDVKTLFYNILSKKGFVIYNNYVIKPIIDSLLRKDNLGVVKIDDLVHKSHEGKELIQQLRNHFCGDIIDTNLSQQKPIVVIPELTINEDVSANENYQNKFSENGFNISRNLLEITIQLTGQCELNCENCGIYSKQTLWCTKRKEIISIKEIKYILSKIEYWNVRVLNFIGGDVLSYAHLSEIVNILKETPYIKKIYFHYKNIDKYIPKIKKLVEAKFNITVLVDSSCFHREKWPSEFNYIFCVSSVNEFEQVQNIIDINSLKAKVLPIYTGENALFFEKYIYQTEEDILNTEWEKKNIYAHQAINTNYFGKLYIAANKNIYINLNRPPIGVIYDDFTALIHSEINYGEFWRKTRDTFQPCMSCLYKYLCPSLSNYELVIGKPNLCHIIK